MGRFHVLKFAIDPPPQKKKCGESFAVVNTDIIELWLEKLSMLEGRFKDCDIKDCDDTDETCLFYKCLAERRLVFKGESCHDGKHSKENLQC